jgi:hypothetical protein
VSIENSQLYVTAPQRENVYAEQDGSISVILVGNAATENRTFTVAAGYNYVIDFEDERVSGYLAGPTSYGENLYSGYGDNRYYKYDDAGSGLNMPINESLWYGEIDFTGGGVAISQWNNITTLGYENQCSVYYIDPVTGKGGYKGSSTFAVGYGYYSQMFGDSQSSIIFEEDETKECVFDHFYVTNSTYAVLDMQNGSTIPSKIFSYADQDWFKLIIKGFDKDDEPTGTVEFYLADFRTPSSPGIITNWTKVDLSPLGKVHSIKFDLQSSDNGQWGMNTPSYFCFDNLAFWQ